MSMTTFRLSSPLEFAVVQRVGSKAFEMETIAAPTERGAMHSTSLLGVEGVGV